MADAALPEPKEDYQKKLKAFIADIPPLDGAEIKSGTPALRAPFKKADIEALGDRIKTDPLFRKYTGWEHKALLENLAILWIHLALAAGHGRDWTFIQQKKG